MTIYHAYIQNTTQMTKNKSFSKVFQNDKNSTTCSEKPFPLLKGTT